MEESSRPINESPCHSARLGDVSPVVVNESGAAVTEPIRRANRGAAFYGAPALLAALIPKCPLCWVAYGSAFGVAGVAPTAWRWAPATVLVLLGLSFAALVLRRPGATSVALAGLGAVIVVLGLKSAWAVIGAPLLIAAALWPRSPGGDGL